MTAKPGFIFSCDSPDGCFGCYATVAADTINEARASLHDALDWVTSADGDLCPSHREQTPARPVSVRP